MAVNVTGGREFKVGLIKEFKTKEKISFHLLSLLSIASVPSYDRLLLQSQLAAVLEAIEREREGQRRSLLSIHSQSLHFHSDWTGLSHMPSSEPTTLMRKESANWLKTMKTHL